MAASTLIASPQRHATSAHSLIAYAKLLWIGVIAYLLAMALLMRILSCNASSNASIFIRYMCSFRAVALLLLLVDFTLLVMLMWYAAFHDPAGEIPDRRSLYRRPVKLFMAAHRAVRHPGTPHRWKHRISFWIFVVMVLTFFYVVEISTFAFW